MKVLKEWSGSFNSTMYLQEWEHTHGKRSLSLLYGYSMISGNRFESSENFKPEDMDNENSKLFLLLKNDFGDEVIKDI